MSVSSRKQILSCDDEVSFVDVASPVDAEKLPASCALCGLCFTKLRFHRWPHVCRVCEAPVCRACSPFRIRPQGRVRRRRACALCMVQHLDAVRDGQCVSEKEVAPAKQPAPLRASYEDRANFKASSSSACDLTNACTANDSGPSSDSSIQSDDRSWCSSASTPMKKDQLSIVFEDAGRARPVSVELVTRSSGAHALEERVLAAQVHSKALGERVHTLETGAARAALLAAEARAAERRETRRAAAAREAIAGARERENEAIAEAEELHRRSLLDPQELLAALDVSMSAIEAVSARGSGASMLHKTKLRFHKRSASAPVTCLASPASSAPGSRRGSMAGSPVARRATSPHRSLVRTPSPFFPVESEELAVFHAGLQARLQSEMLADEAPLEPFLVRSASAQISRDISRLPSVGSIGSPMFEVDDETSTKATLKRGLSAPIVRSAERQAGSSVLEGMIWLKRTNHWVVRYAVLGPPHRHDSSCGAAGGTAVGSSVTSCVLRYGENRREAMSEHGVGGVRDIRLEDYDLSASGPESGWWTISLRRRHADSGPLPKASPTNTADRIRDALRASGRVSLIVEPAATASSNYQLRFESKQLCMRWLCAMGSKPTPEEEANLRAEVERATEAVARGSLALMPKAFIQGGQPSPVMAQRPL